MVRTTNRFTKGSAMYACRCCGRNTRDTGRGDNEGVQLCAECYDLSGEENHLSDNGTLYDNPVNVLAMIAAVASKGGDASKWDHLREIAQQALPAAPAAQSNVKIEAGAQRLLEQFNKFGNTVQSKTNRKFFLDIVDNARINANDTVYIERASDDWEAIFRGTIREQLDCFGSQFQGTVGQLNLTLKYLRAYFAKLGI